MNCAKNGRSHHRHKCEPHLHRDILCHRRSGLRHRRCTIVKKANVPCQQEGCSDEAVALCPFSILKKVCFWAVCTDGRRFHGVWRTSAQGSKRFLRAEKLRKQRSALSEKRQRTKDLYSHYSQPSQSERPTRSRDLIPVPLSSSKCLLLRRQEAMDRRHVWTTNDKGELSSPYALSRECEMEQNEDMDCGQDPDLEYVMEQETHPTDNF